MKMNEHYNEEEVKMIEELCDTINADKELQLQFKELAVKTLRKFAKGMIFAYTIKDKQIAAGATEQAGEEIKALAAHMYVKVTMKKKEVK